MLRSYSLLQQACTLLCTERCFQPISLQAQTLTCSPCLPPGDACLLHLRESTVLAVATSLTLHSDKGCLHVLHTQEMPLHAQGMQALSSELDC